MSLGDSIYNALENVEGVNLQELERSRQLGNQFSASAGQLSEWATPQGLLTPSLFSRYGPPGMAFTNTPLEAAHFRTSGAFSPSSAVGVFIDSWNEEFNTGVVNWSSLSESSRFYFPPSVEDRLYLTVGTAWIQSSNLPLETDFTVLVYNEDGTIDRTYGLWQGIANAGMSGASIIQMNSSNDHVRAYYRSESTQDTIRLDLSFVRIA